MTTTQPFAGALHYLEAGQTFALWERHARSPYSVLLHADTETPLWILNIENVWGACQRAGRHVDFAIIDTARRWVVFVELRRSLNTLEEFFDKVEQARETINRLCKHQLYGQEHHAEARTIDAWQTSLAQHALGVCIVPAIKLKDRADQRHILDAPDGRQVAVVVAGHLRHRQLSWRTILARLGDPDAHPRY